MPPGAYIIKCYRYREQELTAAEYGSRNSAPHAWLHYLPANGKLYINIDCGKAAHGHDYLRAAPRRLTSPVIGRLPDICFIHFIG